MPTCTNPTAPAETTRAGARSCTGAAGLACENGQSSTKAVSGARLHALELPGSRAGHVCARLRQQRRRLGHKRCADRLEVLQRPRLDLQRSEQVSSQLPRLWLESAENSMINASHERPALPGAPADTNSHNLQAAPKHMTAAAGESGAGRPRTCFCVRRTGSSDRGAQCTRMSLRGSKSCQDRAGSKSGAVPACAAHIPRSACWQGAQPGRLTGQALRHTGESVHCCKRS